MSALMAMTGGIVAETPRLQPRRAGFAPGP
jgi:hypothetical protein